jgi:hypothetical protein
MRVVEHRVIYKDERYYCGPGPSIVCDGEGNLLVAFRRVRSWLGLGHMGHWHPATELCLTRSADGGQSWSLPQVFLAGYQCPCLTRLRDDTLILSTHRMELAPEELGTLPAKPGARQKPWPGLHAGTGIWRSVDGGICWGDAVYLGGVAESERLHASLPEPLAVRGNVLECRSGRLLVSAYSIGEENCSYLFASDDGGSSWGLVEEIAADFNETYLHETDSGNLLAFMRRWSDSEYLHRSVSRDGGLTWSAPTVLCRGYPACAVGVPDGIFIAYGYRFAPNYGVRARLLAPAGELVGEDELVLRGDGAVSDLGYPHACLLPDGRMAVVYYANSKRDADDGSAPRYIELALVEVQ